MSRDWGLSLNVKFMSILLLVSIIPTLLVSISSLGGYNQMQNRFFGELETFRTNYTLSSDEAEINALRGARKAVIGLETERLERYNTRVAERYSALFSSLQSRAASAASYIGVEWSSFDAQAPASFDGVVRGVQDDASGRRNRLSHVGAYLSTLTYAKVATAVYATDNGWVVTQTAAGNVTGSTWYLAAAAAEGPTITGPSKVFGQRSIVVAAPVERDGNFAGVVALVVPVDRLDTGGAGNVSTVLVDAQTDVVRADGVFSRFRGANLLSAGPSGIQQVAGRLSTGEEGVMNVSYRDSERYVAYTTVEGTGFRVASMLGTQVMFREANEVGKSITKAFLSLDAVVTDRIVALRQSFRSNLLGIVYKYALILAMLVLAVMVAGFYFARAVTQPVRRLKEKADLVSRGAVEEDIQIDTGDELEELATAFNRVIHTIKILQGRDSPASYGKPDVGEKPETADDDEEEEEA